MFRLCTSASLLLLALFAIGCDSTVTRSGGGPVAGNLWSVVHPPRVDFTASWKSPSGEIYAAGGHEPLMRFDGTRWTVLDLVRHGFVWDMWARSESEIYLVGEGFIRSGRPNNWKTELTPTTGDRGAHVPVVGIWGVGDRVFAVGGRPAPSGAGELILEKVGGEWRSATLPAGFEQGGLRSVWGRDENDVFAVGDDGRVLRYDGSSWSLEDVGTIADFFTVTGIGDDVFIGGGFFGNVGMLVIGTDSGYTQHPLPGGSTRVVAISGTGADDLTVLCGDEEVYAFDGTDFTFVEKLGQSLGGILGVGRLIPETNSLLALTFDGQVHRRSGGVWTSISPTPYELFLGAFDCAGTLQEGLVLGSTNGRVQRYDGLQWVTELLGTQQSVTSVHDDDEGRLWASVTGGDIYRRESGEWELYDDTLDGVFVRDHWIDPQSRMVAVSADQILRWAPVGPASAWEAPQGVALAAVTGDTDEIIAVGNQGTILRVTGSTLVDESLDTADLLVDVWKEGGFFYAGSTIGQIYRREGNRWESIVPGISASFVSYVGGDGAPLIGIDLIVGIESAGRLYEMVGGTWRAITPLIRFSDRGPVFVGGGVIPTTDRSFSWPKTA